LGNQRRTFHHCRRANKKSGILGWSSSKNSIAGYEMKNQQVYMLHKK